MTQRRLIEKAFPLSSNSRFGGLPPSIPPKGGKLDGSPPVGGSGWGGSRVISGITAL